VLVAAAICWQILCEPIVGIADNRDFWRVMNQAGVGYRSNPDVTNFSWLHTKYAFVPRQPVQYLTSETWIARVAVGLDKLVAKDGLFDIRALGLCNAALLLAGVWLLVWGHRERHGIIRAWVALASLVMFTDVRIVAWMNTFYSDPASLGFGLVTIALALVLAEQRLPRPAARLAYAGFTLAASAFLVAKTQNLAFVPALAVIAFACFPASAWQLAPPRRRLLAALVPLLLCGLFVWALTSDAYAQSKGINVRVVLDEEILPHSPDADRDLRELHAEGHDYARLTIGDIARFHLRHPGRWWKMCRRTAHDTFTWIRYGNFDVASGMPAYAQSRAFGFYSEWKEAHFPRALVAMLLWALAYLGLLVLLRWRLRRRGRGGSPARPLVCALLVFGALCEFFVTVSFEANGNAKHLFLFDCVVDVLIILAGVDLLELLLSLRAAAPASSSAAETHA
jgi:hypothetical protein